MGAGLWERYLGIDFTGERIVPGAANCEPAFAQKMYQEHIARYAFAAQLAKGGDVLDVACGVGYGAQWLAKAGAKSVLGTDIAEDAIDHARKNYFHPSVSFEVQDARTMDFEGKFDVVTCFEFIEHVDEQAAILDAIKRALRPGGLLFISTPRPLLEKRTDFHVHELEFQELQRMLGERFAHVDSYFERNCFSSYVGASSPEVLDHIVRITDKLHLDDADYFIFVARDSGKSDFQQPQAVIALNDDSYVLRLEEDIVNFRNGENYHNQLIQDVSEKNRALSAALESARSELDASRKEVESLSLMQQEISRIAADLASMREETARQQAESVTSVKGEMLKIAADVASIHEEIRASAELAGVQEELESVRRSRDEFARQTEQLLSENGRIRTVLAKVAQQLAEAETSLNSKLGEADQLRKELSAARDAHAREFEQLSLKYEECERTLNRFRRSVSWSVTRPLRWVGRQYRKATGRSVG